MDDHAAKGAAIDELPGKWDGFARLVRAGLEIEGFGANVMNLPPDYSTRSHDEAGTGQEELYVCLSGSGAVVLEQSGEEIPLDPDHLAAVGPGVARTLRSGSEGLRVLIVGGAKGRPYEPQDWSSEADG